MSTLESVRWNELHQNPSKNQKKVDMILNDQHKIREQSNAMTILNAFCSLRRCAKEPFVDFATTRNRVLQIAGQRAEYQGLKSAFATAPSHVDETQHIWIRWIVLYFVVLNSFLNMCPFLTKVVLSAFEVSVAQGLYWSSVEMKRFTRAIIYDVSSPSMLASVAVQRTTGVAMLRIWGGPKQELYHDVKGIHIFLHSNVLVFEYLT